MPKEPSFANTVYGSSSAAYKINVVPYLRISRALWTVGGKCLWDEAGSLYPVNEGSTTKSPAQADSIWRLRGGGRCRWDGRIWG